MQLMAILMTHVENFARLGSKLRKLRAASMNASETMSSASSLAMR